MINMNHDILSKFEDDKLLEGIKIFYQNAQELFNAGCCLADKEKFGFAIALTVLSIEELIKAFAIFQVYIGETKPGNIDPAFRGNNIHKQRLKLAYYYDFIFESIDKSNFENLIIQKFESKDNNVRIDVQSKEEILIWVDNQIDNIIPAVKKELLDLSEYIEDNINNLTENQSNWFSQAQTIKEKGLYTDYINNNWHVPQNMNKKDYDKAITNATEIFKKIGNPIRIMIKSDDLKSLIIRRILKRMLKSIATQ